MRDYQIRLDKQKGDRLLDILDQAYCLAFDEGSLLTEPLRILTQRRLKWLEKRVWSEVHNQYVR